MFNSLYKLQSIVSFRRLFQYFVKMKFCCRVTVYPKNFWIKIMSNASQLVTV